MSVIKMIINSIRKHKTAKLLYFLIENKKHLHLLISYVSAKNSVFLQKVF